MQLKRIDYFIDSLNQGGAQQVVVDLAKGFKKIDAEVRVIILLEYPGSTNKHVIELQRNGIPLLSLGYKKNENFLLKALALLRSAFRLALLLRHNQTEILHSHLFLPNLLSRLAAFLSYNTKIINTVHSEDELPFVSKKMKSTLYTLLRHTDRFISHCSHVSQKGMAIYTQNKLSAQNKLTVIPNGINTDHFRPKHDSSLVKEGRGTFTWLAAGRLIPQKNYPCLLEAVKILTAEQKELQVMIAGRDGGLENTLKKKRTELGLDHQVHFIGSRDNMVDLFQQCDAFVLSSDSEGLPLVCAEAMACEKILVATRAGDTAQIVNNTDFLVPTGNPKELANKMAYVMQLEKEEKNLLEKQNRERILNLFSLDSMLSNYSALYQKILSA